MPPSRPRRASAGKPGRPGRPIAIRVARVYDPPGPDDGTRVLVDRLWPRGLKKEDAKLDHWCKEIAPSDDLRTWYRHDPTRLEEFATRYQLELDDATHTPALEALRRLHRQETITLLTATKDLPLSHATVLAEVLTD